MDFGSNVVQVPCCICGVMIDPNPNNMCIDCLRSKVNFTDDVPQSTQITYCKNCGRYQTNPTTWIHADLDSPELMQICLKRLTGLKGKRIVDSQFLYTEPHSRRIRISLTLEKEALKDSVLRQTVIVTFVVGIVQCPQCVEAATPREHWIANVQLRQSVDHKRSLFHLEQQILSHNAHQGTTSVERKDGGVDFHFADQAGAERFLKFLLTLIPAKWERTMKQVGEDFQNGTKDMRFSLSVRCPPLCRQDLVILTPKLVRKTGNQCRVAVVHRVGRKLRLVDPMTGLIIDVDRESYWKDEFGSALTIGALKRFNVLSIEPFGERNGPFQVADVMLADEGYNEQVLVRTHLGDVLHEGEPCLAYDTRALAITDKLADALKAGNVSEVIIVGRTHEKSKKRGVRQWKLKELAPHASSDDEEFENFMEDLEDSPDLRKDVRIFRNPDAEEKKPDEILETQIAISEMQVDDGGQHFSFAPQPE